MTKFCKDCKYCFMHIGVGYCYSPNNGIDIVTGEPRGILAQHNRSLDCGTEAEFFEEKEKEPAKESFRSKIMKLFTEA